MWFFLTLALIPIAFLAFVFWQSRKHEPVWVRRVDGTLSPDQELDRRYY